MNRERNILEENIMRRVRLIWFGRYIKQSRLARFLLLLALVAFSRLWISFDHIFENMRGVGFEAPPLSQYIRIAVVTTEPAVQIILAVLAFIAILFIVDFGKLLTRGFHTRTMH